MMYEGPAVVRPLKLPENRRILVVSDIHANMPYFKGLLKKANFSDRDELIIDGDFLEKGADSLGTLRYIMELSKKGNVHTVCGNCDYWFHIFSENEAFDEHILHYILHNKKGIIWDMCNASGIDLFEIDSFTACKRELFNAFKEEWRFLAHLPNVLETENFIFAHAGIDPAKPLSEQSLEEVTRCPAFLTSGRSFDKWVIAGHWPVMLYGTDRVCANPIVDSVHKIVSIDGGCVLKDDGQLNALIIPDKYSDNFSFTAYDPFPERVVMDDQQEGERSYYIRWGDSRVQVLERGEEFSRCRHVRTGYEMDILTKYLFTDNEYTDCNDCTDYILPLKRGDVVRVVEECSRGYFVKHGGWSGWYYGELE
ncbi:MAG: metallophosphoesterase [Candidatus Limivicinus sp.]|jgi:hypothetical protein